MKQKKISTKIRIPLGIPKNNLLKYDNLIIYARS